MEKGVLDLIDPFCLGWQAQPCGETIERILLYAESVARYGSSPCVIHP